MQVTYTQNVTMTGAGEADKVYSVYAVTDGPKDNEYHLFDVYVNVQDKVINVRGLYTGADGSNPMPLVPTTGVATLTSDMVMVDADTQTYRKIDRVNGGSVRSYVTPRAGRLTAMAYAVGVKLQPAAV
jgi:hypothetical protein